jgi:hypothetical protein
MYIHDGKPWVNPLRVEVFVPLLGKKPQCLRERLGVFVALVLRATLKSSVVRFMFYHISWYIYICIFIYNVYIYIHVQYIYIHIYIYIYVWLYIMCDHMCCMLADTVFSSHLFVCRYVTSAMETNKCGYVVKWHDIQVTWVREWIWLVWHDDDVCFLFVHHSNLRCWTPETESRRSFGSVCVQ